MSRRPLVLLVLLIAILAASCGGSQPTATPAAGATEGQSVSFRTDDGVVLQGHLYGSGENGVVLAHMFPSDERSWQDFAQALAQHGFTALTFNFRGYPPSGGEQQIDKIDHDEAAAYAFLEGRGVKHIALAGASMGGTASIIVGSSKPIAALITLSAPAEFRGLDASTAIRQVKAPALFVASEADDGAAAAAQFFYSATAGPKELKIFTGDAHGTNLLTGDHAQEVRDLLLSFLSAHR